MRQLGQAPGLTLQSVDLSARSKALVNDVLTSVVHTPPDTQFCCRLNKVFLLMHSCYRASSQPLVIPPLTSLLTHKPTSDVAMPTSPPNWAEF